MTSPQRDETANLMQDDLLTLYDGVICDLDGVVYRGADAVPHAVDVLGEVAHRGRGVVYATNNASRTPDTVAVQLRALGLVLDDAHVVSSSQAGAERVVQLVGEGASVLAVGGEGVRQALTERGLTVLDTAAARGGSRPRAVLQGYGADVSWRDLAEAAYAVSAGAVWVATNDDATLPTERGTAPGNGTLVAAVKAATGAEPVVVGKPHTPLYDLSAKVLGTARGRTLAVGDRLNTDIAGANAASIDALLVLTGVSTVAELVGTAPQLRPRYIGFDLRCLLEPYAVAQRRDPAPGGTVAGWACGDALVTLDDGGLSGLQQGSAANRLRASMAAVWAAVDASGRSGGTVSSSTTAATLGALEIAVAQMTRLAGPS